MSSESQRPDLSPGETVSAAWGAGTILCTIDHTYRNGSGEDMVVLLLPRGSGLDDRDVTVAVPRSSVTPGGLPGTGLALTDQQKADLRQRMALAVLHDQQPDPAEVTARLLDVLTRGDHDQHDAFYRELYHLLKSGWMLVPPS